MKKRRTSLVRRKNKARGKAEGKRQQPNRSPIVPRSSDVRGVGSALKRFDHAQQVAAARGADLLAVAHGLRKAAVQEYSQKLVRELLERELPRDILALRDAFATVPRQILPEVFEDLRLLPDALIGWLADRFDLEPSGRVGEEIELPTGRLGDFVHQIVLPEDRNSLIRVQVTAPGWKKNGRAIVAPSIRLATPDAAGQERARITRCLGMSIDLLKRYGTAFDQRMKAQGLSRESPAGTLAAAIAFGRTITTTIQTLIQRDDHALFADAPCRTYYELATRLLWAAQEQDGWQRLQAYWADEIRKQAKEVLLIPSLAHCAQERLKMTQEVLSRKDASGNTYTPAPDVFQMLRAIDEQNVRDGLGTSGQGFAQYGYTVIYRSLCQTTHGHIPAMSILRPAPVRRTIAATTVYATWMLLRAVCHASGADQASENAALGAEIFAILKDIKPTSPCPS